MKAAFQGEIGSNSFELCREQFPDYAPAPCRTFPEMFEAVRSGACEIGLAPVENSCAGRVEEVHALLPRSGLKIVGERLKPIHFDLMAPAGTRLEDVVVVRSHPMALAQCRRLIGELGAVAEPALDTAGAARELAETPRPGVAALAPPAAAARHGLAVLASSVEDGPDNVTRFLVLSAADASHEDGLGGSASDALPILTSLMFRISDEPASLFKALGAFATNGVNLLKLESHREGAVAFNSALFYAEIIGAPEAPNVARALEEVAFFTREYAILGAYPADPARRLAAATAPRPSEASNERGVARHGRAVRAETFEQTRDWRVALERLRHSIDNIDAAVIHLLAERFKVTRHVGELKARFELPASDPVREAQQLSRLRLLAQAADLDPSFAEKLLGFVIAEVVSHHKRLKA